MTRAQNKRGGILMRFRIAALAAIMPAFLLGACASSGPLNRSVPLAARDKIAATDVIMPIGQNEIVIAIPISTAGTTGAASFGMLGALVGSLVDAGVDASNAAAAETSVKPLRNVMVDFSFDDTLNADVQSRITQANWIKPGGYRIVKEVTPQNLERVLKESKASTLLFTSASYNLNFNADRLSITMVSRLLPNTPELQALLPEKFDPKASQITSQNELYRNTFIFETAVAGATTNRDINIGLWSANNGAAMRDALKLGSSKLTEMLVSDLMAEPSAPIDPKTTTLKAYKGLAGVYVMAKDDVGTQLLQQSGYQSYVTDIAQAALVSPPSEKAKTSGKAKTGTR